MRPENVTDVPQDRATTEPRKRSVSFVVPALNEGEAVRGSVREIIKAAEGRLDDYEIILVNDGSTDNTGEVIDRLAADHAFAHVVHNERNLGFGGAYKRGVAAANLNYVMMVPGDDAHPAPGLAPILDQVGEADIVVPYVLNPESRSWFRRLLSRSFVLLLNTLFGRRLRYYNGLVVHRRDLLNEITITTDGFSYQAEALIKLLRRGATYVEVGVLISERKGGRSSALKPRNVAAVLRTVWYLWRTT